MFSIPLLHDAGWIILSIITCMCLSIHSLPSVQCTLDADSTGAFTNIDMKYLKFTANALCTGDSDDDEPSESFELSGMDSSYRIPNAIRAYRGDTITQASVFERLPVAGFKWQSSLDIEIVSEFQPFPDFRGLMALTFFLDDHAAKNDSYSRRGEHARIRAVTQRIVEIIFHSAPPDSGISGMRWLTVRGRVPDVYFGAYEIPNNTLPVILGLKRMGLLHRAFFFGSMYLETKPPKEEYTDWHFLSWFDVLGADALARVDAVETLSVEYEVWTHLYDLPDAPPHLQYASMADCTALPNTAGLDNRFKGVKPSNYSKKSEWLTCPTPHPNFASIFYAEHADSHGEFYKLVRDVHFANISAQWRQNARKLSQSDNVTLALQEHKHLLILSGTVVFLETNVKDFVHLLELNITVQYKSRKNDFDRIHTRFNAEFDNESRPKNVQCTTKFPMICHFVYIHEMALTPPSDTEVFMATASFWGTVYLHQIIRNASVALVALTPDEYDTVVQRSRITATTCVQSSNGWMRPMLGVLQAAMRPAELYTPSLTARLLLNRAHYGNDRRRTLQFSDLTRELIAFQRTKRVRRATNMKFIVQYLQDTYLKCPCYDRDAAVSGVTLPDFCAEPKHLDRIEVLLRAGCNAKEGLSEQQQSLIVHPPESSDVTSCTMHLHRAHQTLSKLDALNRTQLRGVMDGIKQYSEELDVLYADALTTSHGFRMWIPALIGGLAGVLVHVCVIAMVDSLVRRRNAAVRSHVMWSNDHVMGQVYRAGGNPKAIGTVGPADATLFDAFSEPQHREPVFLSDIEHELVSLM